MEVIGNIIAHTGIMIILAVSLNLICGITGMLSLGHFAFFGMGGYLGALLVVFVHKTQIVTVIPGFILFCLIILIGGVFASLLGLIVGFPFLKLKGDYLAVATLGFNIIFIEIIENLSFVGGPKGYSIYNKLGSSWPKFQTNLIWIYLFVIFSIFLIYRIMKAKQGRNLLSIREDEIAADSLGVNPAKYKIFSFVVGSFLAGIAGVLFVMYDKMQAHPSDFGFLPGIEVLLMIVLGGLGSMSGAIIGAVILTVLLQVLKLIPGVSNQPVLFYSVLLILIMVLKPSGIMGRKEISDLNWYQNLRKKLFKNRLKAGE